MHYALGPPHTVNKTEHSSSSSSSSSSRDNMVSERNFYLFVLLEDS